MKEKKKTRRGKTRIRAGKTVSPGFDGLTGSGRQGGHQEHALKFRGAAARMTRKEEEEKNTWLGTLLRSCSGCRPAVPSFATKLKVV